jgi:hypothetical protein
MRKSNKGIDKKVERVSRLKEDSQATIHLEIEATFTPCRMIDTF